VQLSQQILCTDASGQKNKSIAWFHQGTRLCEHIVKRLLEPVATMNLDEVIDAEYGTCGVMKFVRDVYLSHR